MQFHTPHASLRERLAILTEEIVHGTNRLMDLLVVDFSATRKFMCQ